MPQAFIAIGTFLFDVGIISSFTASTWAAIGTYVAGMVISSALSYAAQALLTKRQDSMDKSDFYGSSILVNRQSNNDPIPIIYGRRTVGGTVVFGPELSDNNNNVHMVIAVAEGRIKEIATTYANDVDIEDTKYGRDPGLLGGRRVFSSDYYWTYSTPPWSLVAPYNVGELIASPIIHCDGTQVSTTTATQTFASIVGTDYFIKYSIQNYVSGSVYISIGGANSTSKSANGTFEEWVEATTTGPVIITASADFVGDIYNLYYWPRNAFVTSWLHTGADDQVVDSTLNAQFPTKWDSTHALKGTAYAYIKAEFDSTGKTFPSGLPTFTFDTYGKIIYDPREDSTHTGANNQATLTDSTKAWTTNALVGGVVYNITKGPLRTVFGIITANTATTITATLNSGDWDNADSYELDYWTPNSALCIRDYLTNTRYGRSISSDEIDDASFIVAADECDLWQTFENFGYVNNIDGYSAEEFTIIVDGVSAHIGVGDFIKFANHNTDYEILTINTDKTQITISPSLTYSVANDHAFHKRQRKYTCNGYLDPSENAANILDKLTSSCRGMLIFSGGLWKLIIDRAENCHTGADNASVLTDRTKAWTTNAYIGYTINNTTDNSSGTITANTATTITATLSGGTQNDWDEYDDYEIVDTNGDIITHFTFDEDNIIGDWEISLGNKSNTVNKVTANFFNKYRSWQPDMAPVESTVNRVADNNLLLERKIDLPYTDNFYTAKYIATVDLKQSRNQITCRFTATISGTRCEVGDIVYITHSTPGWVKQKFRVLEIKLQNNDEIKVTCVWYASNVYDLDTITVASDAPSPGLFDPTDDIPKPTALTLTETYVRTEGKYVNRVIVSWTASTSKYVEEYILRYKKVSDAATEYQYISISDLDNIKSDIDGLEIGIYYDFGIQAKTNYGARSEWLEKYLLIGGSVTSLTALGIPDPTSPKVYFTATDLGVIGTIKLETGYDTTSGAIPDGIALYWDIFDYQNALTFSDGGTGTSLTLASSSIVTTNINDASTKYIVVTGSTTTKLNVISVSGLTLNMRLNPDKDLVSRLWCRTYNSSNNATQWRKVVSCDSTSFYFADTDDGRFDLVPGTGKNVEWVELNWSDLRTAAQRLLIIYSGSNYEIIKWTNLTWNGSNWILTVERELEGTSALSATNATAYFCPGLGSMSYKIPRTDFIESGGVYYANPKLFIQKKENQIGYVTCSTYINTIESFLRGNIIPVTDGGPL